MSSLSAGPYSSQPYLANSVAATGSGGEQAFVCNINSISTILMSAADWSFKASDTAGTASAGTAFIVKANQPFIAISFLFGDPQPLAGKRIYITPGASNVLATESLRWQP